MKHETSQISDEIADLLASTPKTTQEMLEELAKANRELQNDPEFIADFERMKFVDSILEIMNDQNVKRTELARNLGKSRQYVQKVLDEDARVSFTLKTMVQLCHALGKRLKLDITDRNASATSLSFQKKLRMASLRSELFADSSQTPARHINLFPKQAPASAKRFPKILENDENRLSA